MVFIALCGPHNSGKETIAKYLVNKYGFIRVSFYDTIMKACQDLFLLSDDEVKKENANKPISILKDVTPNELRKTIISALNSNIELEDERNKNLHLSILTWNITRRLISMKGKNVVVSDLRYRQEELALHMLGTKIIRVLRDNCTYAKDENEHLIFDYSLYNDTSIDNLLNKADKLVCELMTKEKPVNQN